MESSAEVSQPAGTVDLAEADSLNGTVSELDKSPTSVQDELNSTATTGQSSISNLDTTVDLQEVTLNSTVTEHTPKKKSKKRGGGGSGTPKAAKPKPKSFVKDEIVIECYITRNVKGKTKTGEDTWRTNTLVFKLDETPHRTKESFDELEDTINVRVCVTGSSSKNRKTTVLSVDDGSGQEMVKYMSDNCYLFTFDHVDVIKESALKAIAVLMEKTDPDDEEKERQSDFKQWTEDLDKQIQLAKDFLKRKESEGGELSALAELTNPTHIPTKKEEEERLLLEKSLFEEEEKRRKEEEKQRKEEERQRKEEERQRKVEEKRQKKLSEPVTKTPKPTPTKKVSIKSTTPKVEKSECSGCSRCQMEDCGSCRSCKDKPKNGGRGTLRQICEIRAQNARCNAKSPRAPKESPMSKVKKSPKASSSAEEGTTNSGLLECKVRISPVTLKESAMSKANKKRSASPNDLGDSLLSKARTKTTLAGETSKKSLTPQVRRRKTRCGKCSGCKKENCGLCRNCRDMPKFGGKGKLRLACALRVCRELSTSPKDLEKSTKTVMQAPSKKDKASVSKSKPKSTSNESNKSSKPAPKESKPNKKPVKASHSKSKSKSTSNESNKSSKPAPKETKPNMKPVKLGKMKFNFTKKSKDKASKVKRSDREPVPEPLDDSAWLDELVTPESSPENEKMNTTIDKTQGLIKELQGKLDEGINKLQSIMDSMNKSPAEEVEKTGIDQRYPIDAEEYHDWVASEEGTEFLRKIITEENDTNLRCMKRHNLFVKPYHPETDVKKYCRMDFLDDDDGYWEDEIKKVIIKNLFRPCGPPPSISHIFDEEEWWMCRDGLHYFLYCLYSEGLVHFIQKKYPGTSYEKAEAEFLKPRYTRKELDEVDKAGQTFLRWEKERKEKERRAREQERREKEEAARRQQEEEDEMDDFVVPDIESDSEVDNESLQPSPTTQPPKPSTSLADKKTPTKRKHEAKSGNSTNKKAKKLSHDD